jgi:hypothetical protein
MGRTAHNRIVNASPLKRLGFRSARSWLRHSHASIQHSLPALVFATQSPYSGWQTVVYNRNVRRKFFEYIRRKYEKILDGK